jgi:hypothetical protein
MSTLQQTIDQIERMRNQKEATTAQELINEIAAYIEVYGEFTIVKGSYMGAKIKAATTN